MWFWFCNTKLVISERERKRDQQKWMQNVVEILKKKNFMLRGQSLLKLNVFVGFLKWAQLCTNIKLEFGFLSVKTTKLS